MIAYFDTSALVKLLVSDEAGAETAASIWDAADAAFTSRIAYPEGRAALASARRAGRLTARQLTPAREALAGVFRQLSVVELSAGMAEAAGDVSERFALRAHDAVAPGVRARHRGERDRVPHVGRTAGDRGEASRSRCRSVVDSTILEDLSALERD